MCFRSVWLFVSPLPRLPLKPSPNPTDPGRRLLLLFALAIAGGVIAYAPLLTLLLPAKVAGLAGEERIQWLAEITLFGAIAASAGNILFGWASDIFGTRRGWAAAGLVLTLLSFALLHEASTRPAIIGAIIIYQLALNMMLAPVFAWAADTVPDRRKGVFAGLVAAGQPMGAIVGVIVTSTMLPGDTLRLSAVCLMVAMFTAPLLCMARTPVLETTAPEQVAPPASSQTDFALMWTARLLVQVADSIMFSFLLYYFQSLTEPLSQSDVARLAAGSLILSFPITLLAGRFSDRIGPRKPFLVVAAAFGAIGLTIMANGTGTPAAIGGFVLFSSATAVFSAFHTAYAMQLLPSPTRRGRDLGVLNLTNTFPAIVAPLLAISLVPGRGFELLLGVLAVLVTIAGLCVSLVRHDSRRSSQTRRTSE